MSKCDSKNRDEAIATETDRIVREVIKALHNVRAEFSAKQVRFIYPDVIHFELGTEADSVRLKFDVQFLS